MSADKTERLTLIVPCAHGIHMRVAARIVELLSQFKASVEISYQDKHGDAESIMAVMKLGAEKGAEIQIAATGPDAKEACSAIAELFDSESGLCGMDETGN